MMLGRAVACTINAEFGPPELRAIKEQTLMSDVQTPVLDYTQVIKPVAQYALHNPWPIEWSFEFGAKTYRLPPRGDLAIADRPDVQATAVQVLAFAVGSDGRSGVIGARGIRVLFGDDRDTHVRAEAHKAYLERETLDDAEICRSHELQILAAQNAGAPLPRPTQRVVDAYKRRASREAEAELKFSCPACNIGFKDQHEVAVHTVALHKNRKDLVNEAESFLKLESLNKGTNLDEQVRHPLPPPEARQLANAEASENVAQHLEDKIRSEVRAKKQ